MARFASGVGRRGLASTFVLACGLSLALGGCTRQQIEGAGNTIASAAPALADDGIVIAQIESAFVRIDANSALHVAIAAHGGDVRLSGRATSPAIVARFVEAAKRTPGVKAVDATIVADPHIPSTKKAVDDFALTAAVRANLVAQAGVNALTIGIHTSGGAVALTGHASSAAIATTLVAAARATSGVKSVDDRLVVAP